MGKDDKRKKILEVRADVHKLEKNGKTSEEVQKAKVLAKTLENFYEKECQQHGLDTDRMEWQAVTNSEVASDTELPTISDLDAKMKIIDVIMTGTDEAAGTEKNPINLEDDDKKEPRTSVNPDKPVDSIEETQDLDELPTLISRNDFVGERTKSGHPIPVVSVYKFGNKGYVNRHGPKNSPWWQIGSFVGPGTGDELPNITNPINRRLDKNVEDNKKDAELKYKEKVERHKKEGKPPPFPPHKPTSRDVRGIKAVIVVYNETLDRSEAVELLNPQKVKQTDVYPTKKDRNRATHKENIKFSKYPWHYLIVDWNDYDGTSVERASAYKDLSKSVVYEEKLIYQACKFQYERFQAYWQGDRVPREVSASPLPIDKTDETKGDEGSRITKSVSREVTAPPTDTGPKRDATSQDNAKEDKQQNTASSAKKADEALTRQEMLAIFLKGYASQKSGWPDVLRDLTMPQDAELAGAFAAYENMKKERNA